MLGLWSAADPARAYPSTAGLFFSLYGGASRRILVRKLIVSGSIPAASAHIDLTVVRYSAVFTVGTQVALTPVALAAVQTPSGALATPNVHTVAPTPGTAVGNVGATRILLPLVDTLRTALYEFDFSQNPILLSSATEGIGILKTAVPQQPSLAVWALWGEE